MPNDVSLFGSIKNFFYPPLGQRRIKQQKAYIQVLLDILEKIYIIFYIKLIKCKK